MGMRIWNLEFNALVWNVLRAQHIADLPSLRLSKLIDIFFIACHIERCGEAGCLLERMKFRQVIKLPGPIASQFSGPAIK